MSISICLFCALLLSLLLLGLLSSKWALECLPEFSLQRMAATSAPQEGVVASDALQHLGQALIPAW